MDDKISVKQIVWGDSSTQPQKEETKLLFTNLHNLK